MEIQDIKNRLAELERKQIALNTDAEVVKTLLNITKAQIVVTNIAVLPLDSPTGTIAMQVSPAKLSFKSETGWVTLI